MSSEIQLVLIGGIIAIVSSISTALLTTLLTYWLENRREKHKTRRELSRALGRATMHDEVPIADGSEVYKLYKDLISDPKVPLETLSFRLGLVEQLDEMLKKKNREQD